MKIENATDRRLKRVLKAAYDEFNRLCDEGAPQAEIDTAMIVLEKYFDQYATNAKVLEKIGR